ncbi:hypothetical protein ACERII_03740 [Evansella sp. AB-rgal1]|uniref:hypothetical protein n=1 Tax=Evansella sp. AB-rgal1 TaxID=3242696 RepID=UPI00359DF8AB
MFVNINVINVLYQLIAFVLLIGLIIFVVSFLRKSKEDKKRLTQLEEKVDYIMKKMENDSQDKSN